MNSDSRLHSEAKFLISNLPDERTTYFIQIEALDVDGTQLNFKTEDSFPRYTKTLQTSILPSTTSNFSREKKSIPATKIECKLEDNNTDENQKFLEENSSKCELSELSYFGGLSNNSDKVLKFKDVNNRLNSDVQKEELSLSDDDIKKEYRKFLSDKASNDKLEDCSKQNEHKGVKDIVKYENFERFKKPMLVQEKRKCERHKYSDGNPPVFKKR